MIDLLETPTSTRAGARQRRALRVQPRKFRPDIEGLRAFAVLAVVAYHAGFGVRAGFVGVDVFFVISGFLITRRLLGSVGSQGIKALPAFYTRRIRRLLPAAAVVVVVTVLVARWWAPALQVRSIATDAIFTTFYGVNYRLAVEGTQYLHQNDAVSPLQHFWSLAVEEQFYVLWPVLIVLVAAIGRRHRNVLLFGVLTVALIASFHYSVTVTATSASWAYFSLHTRAWELALGALVALGAPQLARLPRSVAGFGGWAGLLVMLASAFVFSDATHYPGSAAAYPVVGAAAVIACGCGPRRGVERVLGEPLLQCVGRVSYSWYLWHWPMLILAPMIVGHPLSWLARLGIVWLSLVAAVVSYFVVEDPVRRLGRATWQGFLIGFAISGTVLAAGALVVVNPPSFVGSGAAVTVVQADSATSAVVAQMRRAVAAGVGIVDAPRNLTPSLDAAARDLPVADGTNCHADFLTVEQGPCVFGDPSGRHTVVLLGDSHADMWLGTFAEAGRAAGWRVVDWTKSSCPAADLTVVNRSLNRTYTECDAWRRSVERRIATLRPDLVVVSGSENVVDGGVSPQQWSQATLRTMDTLRATSGAKVVLLQDIPVPAHDLPGCVAQHLNSVRSCTFPVGRAYSFPARHRELAAAANRAGFAVVDPQSWICTADTCPAIVGNLLVYRDDTHLTATFSRWLAPMAAPLLAAG